MFFLMKSVGCFGEPLDNSRAWENTAEGTFSLKLGRVFADASAARICEKNKTS